jgi:hypothetical protein
VRQQLRALKANLAYQEAMLGLLAGASVEPPEARAALETELRDGIREIRARLK